MIQPSLASLVQQQLPEFIREDYSTFVLFLEAYSDWLEAQSIDLSGANDIDRTLDQYLGYLRDELAPTIPNAVYTGPNGRLILKHIRELYEAKGSEASYRLLFRLLFNKPVTLSFPSERMLRASDGRWNQDTSIFIEVLQGDPTSIIGHIVDIITDTSILKVQVNKQQRVSVEVDNVVRLSDTLYEIIIDRNYYGMISVGDHVRFGDDFNSVVQATTSSVSVQQPGKGFKPGMMFSINSGKGAGSVVKVVSTWPGGGIRAIQFIRYGTGYSQDFIAVIKADSTKQQVVPLAISVENGKLGTITIANGGADYTAPTAVLSGGSPTQAAQLGEVTVADGVITAVEIVDPGTGYISPPTLTFSDTTGSGAEAVVGLGKLTDYTINELLASASDQGYINASDYAADEVKVQWKNNTAYSVGQLIYFSDNVYQVTAAGTSSTNPPTQTSGSVTDGPTYLYVRKLGGAFDGTYSGAILRTFLSDEGSSVEEDSDSTAALAIGLGSVARYPGYYSTNNGFLDDSICLQDSYYFQAFSYVIQSTELLSTYASAVKSLVHPAGLKMFGEYGVETDIQLNVTLQSIVKILSVDVQDPVELEDAVNFWFSQALTDTTNAAADFAKFLLAKPLTDAVAQPSDSYVQLIGLGKADTTSSYPEDHFYGMSKLLADTQSAPDQIRFDISTLLSDVSDAPSDNVVVISGRLLTDFQGALDDAAALNFTRPLSETAALNYQEATVFETTTVLEDAQSRVSDGLLLASVKGLSDQATPVEQLTLSTSAALGETYSGVEEGFSGFLSAYSDTSYWSNDYTEGYFSN